MKATIKYMEAWAYNMFQSKINQYNYRTVQNTFEVEKETEKAVQLKVDTNDLYTAGGNDYAGDKDYWFVWMPKSAVMLED